MFLAVLLYLQLNTYTRLILNVPLYIAIIGYLQAKNKFCVGYAAASQHNANIGGSLTHDIKDASAIKADKARARRINTQAAIISIIVTLMLLFI